MSEKKLKKFVPLLFLFLILFVTVICLFIRTNYIENKLTNLVDNSLVQSNMTQPDQINIEFNGRNAVLSGMVESEEKSDQIIEFVDDIKGVKFVRGDFQIKPIAKVVKPQPVVAKVAKPQPIKVEVKPVVKALPTPAPVVVDYDKIRQDIVINKIYFDTSKSVIPKKSYENVQNVANILQENSDVRISIVGVADRRGNAAKNQKLSLSRATAVRDMLVELGTDSSQMSLEPIGEIAGTGVKKEDLWKNRRVEFKFIKPIAH